MSMRSSRKSRRRNHALQGLDDNTPIYVSSSSSSHMMETPSKPASTSRTTLDDQPTPPPSSSKKSRRGRRESKAQPSSSTIDSNLIDAHLDGSNAEHVSALIADLQDEMNNRCMSIRNAAEQVRGTPHPHPHPHQTFKYPHHIQFPHLLISLHHSQRRAASNCAMLCR